MLKPEYLKNDIQPYFMYQRSFQKKPSEFLYKSIFKAVKSPGYLLLDKKHVRKAHDDIIFFYFCGNILYGYNVNEG